MELPTESQPDFFELLKCPGITTSTHLGCIYDQIAKCFIVGATGREGPQGPQGPCGSQGCTGFISEAEIQAQRALELARLKMEEVRRQNYINGVCLYVNFTEEAAKKYFETVFRSLQPLRSETQLEIIHTGPIQIQVLREECKQEYNDCQERKKLFKDRIQEQLNKLEEMGCEVDDCHINYPLDCEVKDNWYRSETSYAHCKIEIRCHSKSNFYGQLQQMKVVG